MQVLIFITVIHVDIRCLIQSALSLMIKTILLASKNLLYVFWKILQTLIKSFVFSMLWPFTHWFWTCEVLLDVFYIVEKKLCICLLWIHVHVKWNHVRFDSLCISSPYLLAIVSVMGPSHSKLSWEMWSALLFIYWHLFHCAVTYTAYVYVKFLFLLKQIMKNITRRVILLFFFLIPQYIWWKKFFHIKVIDSSK